MAALPHPSPVDLTLMSGAGLAAFAACARMARRTGDAAWMLWTCALAAFVASLVLRGWPGEIAGDRATALRLLSSATAAIAAAGVARRIPGGVSRVTALDMVPVVLAVSALSITGSPVPVGFGYPALIMHFLYPASYAALLMLAADLALRSRARPVSSDCVAGAGLAAAAIAAMWVTTGTQLTAGWIVTAPDAIRSLGFALLAFTGLRMRYTRGRPGPGTTSVSRSCLQWPWPRCVRWRSGRTAQTAT
jgi:hypothetical protein